MWAPRGSLSHGHDEDKMGYPWLRTPPVDSPLPSWTCVFLGSPKALKTINAIFERAIIFWEPRILDHEHGRKWGLSEHLFDSFRWFVMFHPVRNDTSWLKLRDGLKPMLEVQCWRSHDRQNRRNPWNGQTIQRQETPNSAGGIGSQCTRYKQQ